MHVFFVYGRFDARKCLMLVIYLFFSEFCLRNLYRNPIEMRGKFLGRIFLAIIFESSQRFPSDIQINFYCDYFSKFSNFLPTVDTSIGQNNFSNNFSSNFNISFLEKYLRECRIVYLLNSDWAGILILSKFLPEFCTS